MPKVPEPQMHQWLLVHQVGPESTYRMRVPTGWLYQSIIKGEGTSAVALAFVPDPDAGGATP